MANTITIRRRISSVKSTRQITKAMELVAASKMRKSQEYARASKQYRLTAHSLLRRLHQATDVGAHPLFAVRTVKTRLYVIITSDRGLAGAYNANVLRLFTKLAKADKIDSTKTKVIAIGKQGAQFVRHIHQTELYATYPALAEQPTANDVRPILISIIKLYTSSQVDDVRILYTDLKTNLLQLPAQISLLPASFDAGELPDEAGQSFKAITFEPSVEEVLNNVAERLLEVQLWQAILESIASEQSMRMMAMKQATDNASDLIDDLTLSFNTARQSSITQELAEISGGVEAMK